MKNDFHHYIEIADGVRSGKPCIAGTRISVADIAMMYYLLKLIICHLLCS
ncbi:MAG: DUF433 domain-containing protein [Komarekiella atlantica HA4396-MV6]|nr:DUF433 domain-containing protein [Komarekiella atlantica HA4396-MV6]